VKRELREIIEDEERMNYQRRMGDKWLNDLKKLKTTWQKPYLETVPYIIIIFKQVHSISADGQKKPHYYSEISVSISAGILLASIQVSFISTVYHTSVEFSYPIINIYPAHRH